VRIPAACGTPSGYRRHRDYDDPACEQCKQAHADAERARYQRKKDVA
jgi:hypothetical protein